MASDDDIKRYLQKREEQFARRRREAEEAAGVNHDSDIYFATVSSGQDGYGMSSQHMHRELRKIGTKIDMEPRGQKIGFLYHAPYSLLNLDTPCRVLYTMFESTKIPDDWHDYLQAADRILVPSKFCQGIFEN